MSEEHGADRNIPRLLRSVLTGFKPARVHKLRGHHVSCVATLSQEEGRCGVRQVQNQCLQSQAILSRKTLGCVLKPDDELSKPQVIPVIPIGNSTGLEARFPLFGFKVLCPGTSHDTSELQNLAKSIFRLGCKLVKRNSTRKLHQTGGYELLWCLPNSRSLTVLGVPAGGTTGVKISVKAKFE